MVAALLRLRPGQRVLDLACGSGRHLRALGGRGLRLFGVDRDRGSLAAAAAAAPGAGLARADLRALPLAAGFHAAYAWYASLLLFDEAGNAAALAEAARVLRPGGRLLVQHANPEALAREPLARASRALPGGGRVEEESWFDPTIGVESLSRRVVGRGRMLEGSVRLRYYRASEWGEIAPRAGLRLAAIASTGAGAPVPFTAEALDLIAVLEKPT